MYFKKENLKEIIIVSCKKSFEGISLHSCLSESRKWQRWKKLILNYLKSCLKSQTLAWIEKN
jgi:hypothetical protein